MSLGINYPANWRRAAVFVDKILKGANPATLPVEPPRLELVINLKPAERIGVTIRLRYWYLFTALVGIRE